MADHLSEAADLEIPVRPEHAPELAGRLGLSDPLAEVSAGLVLAENDRGLGHRARHGRSLVADVSRRRHGTCGAGYRPRGPDSSRWHAAGPRLLTAGPKPSA